MDLALAPSAVERPGLSGVAPEMLLAWLAERGEPAYRARQIGDAVWGGKLASIEDAQPLPVELREKLAASFRFDTVARTEVTVTDGGLTEKALHQLDDGALVECGIL